jgi:8-oxo-dGTP pyrophosphatase MutT (NUDIX family)
VKTEKGVIIVAYKNRRKPRFVVMNRTKNWEGWELPKGHLENDDYRETVKLELKEEAGIEDDHIKEVSDLDHTAEWSFEDGGEEIKREYRAFTVELTEDAFIDVNSNPHDEHEQGFFFREQDAKSLLTYDNNIEVLEKAIEEIED